MSDVFRILYIDDSLTHLLAAKMKLESPEVQVAVASSIAPAREQLEGCDLVIIDFHMAEMNGQAVLRELRTRLQAGHRPLFYLYTSDRDIAATYADHGFDGAFTQKGSLAELARQVQNVARLVRMRRAVRQSRTGPR